MSALDKEFISTSWTLSVFPIITSNNNVPPPPFLYQFSNTTPHTFSPSLLLPKDPSLVSHSYVTVYYRITTCFIYLPLAPNMRISSASSRARSNLPRTAGNRGVRYCTLYVRTVSRGANEAPTRRKRLAGSKHVGFNLDSIHTYRYFLNRSSFPCSTTIGRNCGNITIPNYWTRRRREGERRCRREGGREGRERERSIAEIRERMRWKSERRREIGERATHQPRFLPVNYRSRSSSSSDSIYGAASAAAQKTADRCQIFRQCPEDGLFIYQTATKIGRANRRGKFHVSSLSRSTLRVSFYSLRSDHR